MDKVALKKVLHFIRISEDSRKIPDNQALWFVLCPNQVLPILFELLRECRLIKLDLTSKKTGISIA